MGRKRIVGLTLAFLIGPPVVGSVIYDPLLDRSQDALAQPDTEEIFSDSSSVLVPSQGSGFDEVISAYQGCAITRVDGTYMLVSQYTDISGAPVKVFREKTHACEEGSPVQGFSARPTRIAHGDMGAASLSVE